MTRLLLLLLLCPFVVQAQQEDLKPIGTDLVPTNEWNGTWWQSGVKTQYTYDGLDIRPNQLGQYILASGDVDAIREYNAYTSSRQAGGWLIAAGLLTAVVGAPIMFSNRPNSNGKFEITQPFVCPSGMYCGTPVGGGSRQTVTIPNVQRRRSFNTGSALLMGGAILAGVGWGLKLPGWHVRRSVQYYNRALKERGVSWRLTPYSTGMASGIGLVGQL